MQSPVEVALYRWCRSHPQQDELPEQDGLSAVPAVSSQDGPSWSNHAGDRPCLVLALPHRAGLPTLPMGKTAASWASTCWEKFLVGTTLLLSSSWQHSCCHQQSGMWLTLDKTIVNTVAGTPCWEQRDWTLFYCYHTLEHRGCIAFLTLFKLFNTFLIRIQ